MQIYPLTITIDTGVVSSSPGLASSSDGGRDDDDNITNDNTPTIEGKAEVGSII
ncbi:MAG: Ig-like domain-containing protein, partial [Flavobacteriales bacterium]